MKSSKVAETFFLENFNIDRLFNSISKADYLFLYYIRSLEQKSDREGGVYLSDLSAEMHIPMPSISKAVKELQEKGYVDWEMTPERDRTFIRLTNSAIELMNDTQERMNKFYQRIRNEIPEADLQTTIFTVRKISTMIENDRRSEEIKYV